MQLRNPTYHPKEFLTFMRPHSIKNPGEPEQSTLATVEAYETGNKNGRNI